MAARSVRTAGAEILGGFWRFLREVILGGLGVTRVS
jgi:hypothetical protein